MVLGKRSDSDIAKKPKAAAKKVPRKRKDIRQRVGDPLHRASYKKSSEERKHFRPRERSGREGWRHRTEVRELAPRLVLLVVRALVAMVSYFQIVVEPSLLVSQYYLFCNLARTHELCDASCCLSGWLSPCSLDVGRLTDYGSHGTDDGGDDRFNSTNKNQ